MKYLGLRPGQRTRHAGDEAATHYTTNVNDNPVVGEFIAFKASSATHSQRTTFQRQLFGKLSREDHIPSSIPDPQKDRKFSRDRLGLRGIQQDSSEGILPLWQRLFGYPIAYVTQSVSKHQTGGEPTYSNEPTYQWNSIINVQTEERIDDVISKGRTEELTGDNRIEFDVKGRVSKMDGNRSARYEIPPEMTEIAISISRGKRDARTGALIVERSKKEFPPLNLPNQDNGQRKLVPTAFVCHRGVGIGGGHYVAYVLDKTGWFLYNDGSVTPVTQAEVLKEAGTSATLVKYSEEGVLPEHQQNGTPQSNGGNNCWANALMAFAFSFTSIGEPIPTPTETIRRLKAQQDEKKKGFEEPQDDQGPPPIPPRTIKPTTKIDVDYKEIAQKITGRLPALSNKKSFSDLLIEFVSLPEGSFKKEELLKTALVDYIVDNIRSRGKEDASFIPVSDIICPIFLLKICLEKDGVEEGKAKKLGKILEGSLDGLSDKMSGFSATGQKIFNGIGSNVTEIFFNNSTGLSAEEFKKFGFANEYKAQQEVSKVVLGLVKKSKLNQRQKAEKDVNGLIQDLSSSLTGLSSELETHLRDGISNPNLLGSLQTIVELNKQLQSRSGDKKLIVDQIGGILRGRVFGDIPFYVGTDGHTVLSESMERLFAVETKLGVQQPSSSLGSGGRSESKTPPKDILKDFSFPKHAASQALTNPNFAEDTALDKIVRNHENRLVYPVVEQKHITDHGLIFLTPDDQDVLQGISVDRSNEAITALLGSGIPIKKDQKFISFINAGSHWDIIESKVEGGGIVSKKTICEADGACGMHAIMQAVIVGGGPLALQYKKVTDEYLRLLDVKKKAISIYNADPESEVKGQAQTKASNDLANFVIDFGVRVLEAAGAKDGLDDEKSKLYQKLKLLRADPKKQEVNWIEDKDIEIFGNAFGLPSFNRQNCESYQRDEFDKLKQAFITKCKEGDVDSINIIFGQALALNLQDDEKWSVVRELELSGTPVAILQQLKTTFGIDEKKEAPTPLIDEYIAKSLAEFGIDDDEESKNHIRTALKTSQDALGELATFIAEKDFVELKDSSLQIAEELKSIGVDEADVTYFLAQRQQFLNEKTLPDQTLQNLFAVGFKTRLENEGKLTGFIPYYDEEKKVVEIRFRDFGAGDGKDYSALRNQQLTLVANSINNLLQSGKQCTQIIDKGNIVAVTFNPDDLDNSKIENLELLKFLRFLSKPANVTEINNLAEQAFNKLTQELVQLSKVNPTEEDRRKYFEERGFAKLTTSTRGGEYYQIPLLGDESNGLDELLKFNIDVRDGEGSLSTSSGGDYLFSSKEGGVPLMSHLVNQVASKMFGELAKFLAKDQESIALFPGFYLGKALIDEVVVHDLQKNTPILDDYCGVGSGAPLVAGNTKQDIINRLKTDPKEQEKFALFLAKREISEKNKFDDEIGLELKAHGIDATPIINKKELQLLRFLDLLSVHFSVIEQRSENLQTIMADLASERRSSSPFETPTKKSVKKAKLKESFAVETSHILEYTNILRDWLGEERFEKFEDAFEANGTPKPELAAFLEGAQKIFEYLKALSFVEARHEREQQLRQVTITGEDGKEKSLEDSVIKAALDQKDFTPHFNFIASLLQIVQEFEETKTPAKPTENEHLTTFKKELAHLEEEAAEQEKLPEFTEQALNSAQRDLIAVLVLIGSTRKEIEAENYVVRKEDLIDGLVGSLRSVLDEALIWDIEKAVEDLDIGEKDIAKKIIGKELPRGKRISGDQKKIAIGEVIRITLKKYLEPEVQRIVQEIPINLQQQALKDVLQEVLTKLTGEVDSVLGERKEQIQREVDSGVIPQGLGDLINETIKDAFLDAVEDAMQKVGKYSREDQHKEFSATKKLSALEDYKEDIEFLLDKFGLPEGEERDHLRNRIETLITTYQVEVKRISDLPQPKAKLKDEAVGLEGTTGVIEGQNKILLKAVHEYIAQSFSQEGYSSSERLNNKKIVFVLDDDYRNPLESKIGASSEQRVFYVIKDEELKVLRGKSGSDWSESQEGRSSLGEDHLHKVLYDMLQIVAGHDGLKNSPKIDTAAKKYGIDLNDVANIENIELSRVSGFVKEIVAVSGLDNDGSFRERLRSDIRTAFDKLEYRFYAEKFFDALSVLEPDLCAIVRSDRLVSEAEYQGELNFFVESKVKDLKAEAGNLKRRQSSMMGMGKGGSSKPSQNILQDCKDFVMRTTRTSSLEVDEFFAKFRVTDTALLAKREVEQPIETTTEDEVKTEQPIVPLESHEPTHTKAPLKTASDQELFDLLLEEGKESYGRINYAPEVLVGKLFFVDRERSLIGVFPDEDNNSLLTFGLDKIKKSPTFCVLYQDTTGYKISKVQRIFKTGFSAWETIYKEDKISDFALALCRLVLSNDEIRNNPKIIEIAKAVGFDLSVASKDLVDNESAIKLLTRIIQDSKVDAPDKVILKLRNPKARNTNDVMELLSKALSVFDVPALGYNGEFFSQEYWDEKFNRNAAAFLAGDPYAESLEGFNSFLAKRGYEPIVLDKFAQVMKGAAAKIEALEVEKKLKEVLSSASTIRLRLEQELENPREKTQAILDQLKKDNLALTEASAALTELLDNPKYDTHKSALTKEVEECNVVQERSTQLVEQVEARNKRLTSAKSMRFIPEQQLPAVGSFIIHKVDDLLRIRSSLEEQSKKLAKLVAELVEAEPKAKRAANEKDNLTVTEIINTLRALETEANEIIAPSETFKDPESKLREFERVSSLREDHEISPEDEKKINALVLFHEIGSVIYDAEDLSLNIQIKFLESKPKKNDQDLRVLKDLRIESVSRKLSRINNEGEDLKLMLQQIIIQGPLNAAIPQDKEMLDGIVKILQNQKERVQDISKLVTLHDPEGKDKGMNKLMKSTQDSFKVAEKLSAFIASGKTLQERLQEIFLEPSDKQPGLLNDYIEVATEIESEVSKGLLKIAIAKRDLIAASGKLIPDMEERIKAAEAAGKASQLSLENIMAGDMGSVDEGPELTPEEKLEEFNKALKQLNPEQKKIMFQTVLVDADKMCSEHDLRVKFAKEQFAKFKYATDTLEESLASAIDNFNKGVGKDSNFAVQVSVLGNFRARIEELERTKNEQAANLTALSEKIGIHASQLASQKILREKTLGTFIAILQLKDREEMLVNLSEWKEKLKEEAKKTDQAEDIKEELQKLLRLFTSTYLLASAQNEISKIQSRINNPGEQPSQLLERLVTSLNAEPLDGKNAIKALDAFKDKMESFGADQTRSLEIDRVFKGYFDELNALTSQFDLLKTPENTELLNSVLFTPIPDFKEISQKAKTAFADNDEKSKKILVDHLVKFFEKANKKPDRITKINALRDVLKILVSHPNYEDTRQSYDQLLAALKSIEIAGLSVIGQKYQGSGADKRRISDIVKIVNNALEDVIVDRESDEYKVLIALKGHIGFDARIVEVANFLSDNRNKADAKTELQLAQQNLAAIKEVLDPDNRSFDSRVGDKKTEAQKREEAVKEHLELIGRAQRDALTKLEKYEGEDKAVLKQQIREIQAQYDEAINFITDGKGIANSALDSLVRALPVLEESLKQKSEELRIAKEAAANRSRITKLLIGSEPNKKLQDEVDDLKYKIKENKEKSKETYTRAVDNEIKKASIRVSKDLVDALLSSPKVLNVDELRFLAENFYKAKAELVSTNTNFEVFKREHSVLEDEIFTPRIAHLTKRIADLESRILSEATKLENSIIRADNELGAKIQLDVLRELSAYLSAYEKYGQQEVSGDSLAQTVRVQFVNSNSTFARKFPPKPPKSAILKAIDGLAESIERIASVESLLTTQQLSMLVGYLSTAENFRRTIDKDESKSIPEEYSRMINEKIAKAEARILQEAQKMQSVVFKRLELIRNFTVTQDSGEEFERLKSDATKSLARLDALHKILSKKRAESLVTKLKRKSVYRLNPSRRKTLDGKAFDTDHSGSLSDKVEELLISARGKYAEVLAAKIAPPKRPEYKKLPPRPPSLRTKLTATYREVIRANTDGTYVPPPPGMGLENDIVRIGRELDELVKANKPNENKSFVERMFGGVSPDVAKSKLDNISKEFSRMFSTLTTGEDFPKKDGIDLSEFINRVKNLVDRNKENLGVPAGYNLKEKVLDKIDELSEIVLGLEDSITAAAKKEKMKKGDSRRSMGTKHTSGDEDSEVESMHSDGTVSPGKLKRDEPLYKRLETKIRDVLNDQDHQLERLGELTDLFARYKESKEKSNMSMSRLRLSVTEHKDPFDIMVEARIGRLNKESEVLIQAESFVTALQKFASTNRLVI